MASIRSFRYSGTIGTLQTYWDVFCEIAEEVFKNFRRSYAKILRHDLKKVQVVFCKTTEIYSAKILRFVLKKKTKRFSVKLLTNILQKY